MPTITAIHIYTADLSAQLQRPEGGVDFWPHVAKVEIESVLDEPGQCRLHFKDYASTAAATTVGGRLYLHAGRVIVLHFSDGRHEAFRIQSLPRPAVREEDTSVAATVTGVSLWQDLGGAVPRKRLAATGYVDVTRWIDGRTASAALTTLATYELPALFTMGTVATALASTPVQLEMDGQQTFWDLLRALADQVGGEVAFTFSTTPTPRITIDIVEGLNTAAAASQRPIGLGPGTDYNVRGFTWTSDGTGYYSHLLALGGEGGETQTVQSAIWPVTYAVQASGSTTLTLSGDPIYHASALVGLYFGSGGAYYLITAAAVPGTLTVAGDASALTSGSFALDAQGKRLTALPAPERYDGWYVEKPESFDVPPYPNLLVDTGHSANLSAWQSGLPIGAQKVGTPTVEQVADERYTKHGTSSAKVTADKGEGIAFPVTLQHDGAEQVFAAWAHVAAASGEVELTLIDGDGVVWPTAQGQQATQPTERLEAISIEGMTAAAGAALLRLTAKADGQVFYVDALTLTRSNQAYPYAEDMGPAALWRRAGTELVRTGGALPDSLVVEAYDLGELGRSGTVPLVIGGRAALTLDYVPASGQHALQLDTRIVALTETYVEGGVPHIKEVTFSRRREDVTRRFTPPTAKPGTFEKDATLVPRKPELTPKIFQREDSGDRYGVMQLFVRDSDKLSITAVKARSASGDGIDDADEWSAVTAQTDADGRTYYEATVPLVPDHTSDLQMRPEFTAPFEVEQDWPIFAHTYDWDRIPRPALDVSIVPRSDGAWDVLFFVRQDEDSQAFEWELTADDTTYSGHAVWVSGSLVYKLTASPSSGLASGLGLICRVRGYPELDEGAASGEPGPWVTYEEQVPRITDSLLESIRGSLIEPGSIQEASLASGLEVIQPLAVLPNPLTGPNYVDLLNADGTNPPGLYKLDGGAYALVKTDVVVDDLVARTVVSRAIRTDELVIDGVLQIQSGGYIAQGTFASGQLATGVALGDFTTSGGASVNALAGVNSGTVQFQIDATTGRAIFGGGNIIADASGLYISGNSVVLSPSGLTMEAGSINLGGGTFIVDALGNLTATSASITGDVNIDGEQLTIGVANGALLKDTANGILLKTGTGTVDINGQGVDLIVTEDYVGDPSYVYINGTSLNEIFVEGFARNTPTASAVVQADGTGKIDEGWLNISAVAAANSIVKSDGSGRIDEDYLPTSAVLESETATVSTAFMIPVADASGVIDVDWVPQGAGSDLNADTVDGYHASGLFIIDAPYGTSTVTPNGSIDVLANGTLVSIPAYKAP